MKLRTKGKVTSDVNIKDFYKYYKEKSKNPLSFKEYSKILKESNLELLNQIVNNSNEFHIPCRLGKLQVIKRERLFNFDKKQKWAVDYKKTKEHGFVVYFEDKWVYKWVWNKGKAVFINKIRYKFIASRRAKRMVAPALKNKQDYFKIK